MKLIDQISNYLKTNSPLKCEKKQFQLNSLALKR